MNGKTLVWLHGEVKSPPFSEVARRQTGFLLRLLQDGESWAMPDSRPMPVVGKNCHELRVHDSKLRVIWRLIYRIDADAIVIGEVFCKKTQKTPRPVIDACARRFKLYDQSVE